MDPLHPNRRQLKGPAHVTSLALASLIAIPCGSQAQVPDCQPGTQDWKSAIQWLKTANISESEAEAKKNLVTALCFGRQVEYLRENAATAYQRSVESYKLALVENDPAAMFFYALMYERYNTAGKWDAKTGSMIRPPLSEIPAIKKFVADLYERSAKLGFVPSAFQACIRIEDAQRAIPLCEQAAQQANGSMKEQAAVKLAELRRAQSTDRNSASAVGTATGTPSGSSSSQIHMPGVFGIQLGTQLPDAIPDCDQQGEPAKSQPYCVLRKASGQDSALTLEDRARFFLAIGAQPLTLKVNTDVFDVKLLYTEPGVATRNSLAVWVSRDGRPISIRFWTNVKAKDEVVAMLSSKFGRVTREDSTEWTDRTGKVTNRTAVFRWHYPRFGADYQVVRVTATGLPDATGQVDMFDGLLMQPIFDLERKGRGTDDPISNKPKRPI